MDSKTQQSRVERDPSSNVLVQKDTDIESKGLEVMLADDSVHDEVVDFDKKETRRIMRKIDYRLVPLLGVLYL